MKNIKFFNDYCILPLFALILISCNNETKKEDSKDKAEEKNEKKFESKAEEKDANLVVDLVAGNYAEIKMAQLANKNSSNTEVKDVAHYLESDHTIVLNQLKDLAAKKNFSIPSEESQESKDKLKELSEKKGNDFDKSWCNELMVKHEKSINKLEKTDINDPDLKSWVNEALPKLRMHHDRLMQCHNKIK